MAKVGRDVIKKRGRPRIFNPNLSQARKSWRRYKRRMLKKGKTPMPFESWLQKRRIKKTNPKEMAAELKRYKLTNNRPNISLSSRNRRILRLLAEGPMNARMLSNELKIPPKVIVVELKYLKKLGAIKEV